MSHASAKASAVLLLLFVLIARPAAVSGQTDTAPEPAAFALGNRPIATLRATFLGRTPRQRADAAVRRSGALIRTGSAGAVTAEAISGGTLIKIGAEGIFVITPADADTLAGESEAEARDQAVRALALAVREATELRNPTILLWAIVRVSLVTLAFALLLRALTRFARKLGARFETSATERAKRLLAGERGDEAAEVARVAVHAVGHFLTWVAILTCVYLWLTFSLRQFPYTRPWGEQLRGFLLLSLRDVALAIVHAMPGIFFVAVIYFATRIASRFVAALFRAVEQESISLPGIHPETAPPTRRIATVVLWLVALALAYPFIPGSHSDAFKGISVLFGVMVSLGSSGVVSQVASGLILMYSRAIKVGDYVRIRDVEGTVTSLSMMSVKIQTPKREEVHIPNAVVTSAETVNYTRLSDEKGIILYTSVTVGYNVPWRQVHAMLAMAADRTPALKKTPPPFVYQKSLSEFNIEYQLNAYLDKPHHRVRVLARLHRNILDAFNEYGVQILTPSYENEPASGPAIVPKSQWYAAPAKPGSDGVTEPDE